MEKKTIFLQQAFLTWVKNELWFWSKPAAKFDANFSSHARFCENVPASRSPWFMILEKVRVLTSHIVSDRLWL